ncbi:uncharacterized protein LOC143423813 [Xylocopa sonorina]|uniref:uncharacterized protein LOC143423813 n=1 Tax=Xylocopa sonorina TaxID=1818115 RepID=UPI00403B04C8
MLPMSYDFNKNLPIPNRNSSTSSRNSRVTLKQLRSQVAIRFLLAKTKRFNILKQQYEQMQQKKQQATLKTGSSPECLSYLGLAPKDAKLEDRNARKQENLGDFQFLKPEIYECSYCTKIFFHKLIHRRHSIRHLKKIHWCLKCNQGFPSKTSKRRHDLVCRR